MDDEIKSHGMVCQIDLRTVPCELHDGQMLADCGCDLMMGVKEVDV